MYKVLLTTALLVSSAACSNATSEGPEVSEAEIAPATVAPITFDCVANDSRLHVMIDRAAEQVEVSVDGRLVARTSAADGHASTGSFDANIRPVGDAGVYEATIDSVLVEVRSVTTVNAVKLAFRGNSVPYRGANTAATLSSIEVASELTNEPAPTPKFRHLATFEGRRCAITGISPDL